MFMLNCSLMHLESSSRAGYAGRDRGRLIALQLLAGFVLGLLPAVSVLAQAQLGTTVNFYQQTDLKVGNQSLNGNFDLRLTVFDEATDGNQVGARRTLKNVSVDHGQVSPLAVNFGDGVFNGEVRWIAFESRPVGNGGYTTITPRIRVRPVPVALSLPGMRTEQNSSSPNVIGGHSGNLVSPGLYGVTIGGGGTTGFENSASNFALFSTIGGGAANYTYGLLATVSGGSNNQALGSFSTIAGGSDNVATGSWSFAAGDGAKSTASHTFTWHDDSSVSHDNDVENRFMVHAKGGVVFRVSDDGNTGTQLFPSGNSWSAFSDRNFKENFETVDVREILEKVAALPVTRWNLIAQDNSVRHLGPMAQDFHAAFGLGEDEHYISSSDIDGVALAAIQGLNQKLSEEVSSLRRENDALKDRLAALEAAVASLHSQTSNKGEIR